MKIHICWVSPEGDKIIDRLMRLLAERNDWTLGTQPDASADLNYFGLYIDYAQRFTDWRKTPLAAYFSHYEEGTKLKMFWWHTAAERLPTKTITARQYEVPALLSGNIIHTPAPIDTSLFDIREHKKSKKPIIGVSGFVDRSGRKGEHLLARLAGDMEDKAEFIASGAGWPVRIVNKSLDGLPAFYAKLDAYLCTSAIEVIPIPPLEALACGVPIVIPRGVGMLDELPDVPGVYRFDLEDYEGLQAAAQKAVTEKQDREALRKIITDTYTPEAYCTAHAKGFTSVLRKSEKNVSAFVGMERSDGAGESDRHGRRGVFYVAYGDPARKCAAGAIQSFKQHFKDIPVALASDRAIGGEDLLITLPDYDAGARLAKLSVYDATPPDWEYVVYLDADTEVIHRETLLWDILEDGFDMVICKNPSRFHVASAMRRGDNEDECNETYRIMGTEEVIQLNGGVFAFRRNARTRAFFADWQSEWKRYEARDQAALLRALWKNPLKIYVLGNEWNTVVRYDPPDIATWLIHTPMVARRWRGKIYGKLSGADAKRAMQEFSK